MNNCGALRGGVLSGGLARERAANAIVHSCDLEVFMLSNT